MKLPWFIISSIWLFSQLLDIDFDDLIVFDF